MLSIQNNIVTFVPKNLGGVLWLSLLIYKYRINLAQFHLEKHIQQSLLFFDETLFFFMDLHLKVDKEFIKPLFCTVCYKTVF